jgi:hypothetical protein
MFKTYICTYIFSDNNYGNACVVYIFLFQLEHSEYRGVECCVFWYGFHLTDLLQINVADLSSVFLNFRILHFIALVLLPPQKFMYYLHLSTV